MFLFQIVTDDGGSRGRAGAIKALLNLEGPSRIPTHHLLRTRGATVSGVTLVGCPGIVHRTGRV